MLEAKCTKSTYTHNDEQHPFLDINVGDVVLFEKLNGIFWFKGYSKRDDKNVHLTARGLAPEFFYEMFTIMDERSQGTCIKSEKQQEQPVEWKDEYREEDLRTRFAFYTYKNEEDDSVLYLSNVFVEEASRNAGFGTKILKAAERVAETIGAITIRLKVKQDSPANAWYRKRGYGYIAFEGEYDWLEKNLEYLKPKRNKQPGEGLENEIDRFCESMWESLPNFDHSDGDAVISVVKNAAHHFFELGCRRTADMCDEIEYNRQRAEEAEMTKGLEEEIDRLWESFSEEMSGPHNLFDMYRRLARHFAKWGKNNLK